MRLLRLSSTSLSSALLSGEVSAGPAVLAVLATCGAFCALFAGIYACMPIPTL